MSDVLERLDSVSAEEGHAKLAALRRVRNAFVFRSGSTKFLTSLGMLWRYGLSLFRLTKTVKSRLADFMRLYDVQEEGRCGHVASLALVGGMRRNAVHQGSGRCCGHAESLALGG